MLLSQAFLDSCDLQLEACQKAKLIAKALSGYSAALEFDLVYKAKVVLL